MTRICVERDAFTIQRQEDHRGFRANTDSFRWFCVGLFLDHLEGPLVAWERHREASVKPARPAVSPLLLIVILS